MKSLIKIFFQTFFQQSLFLILFCLLIETKLAFLIIPSLLLFLYFILYWYYNLYNTLLEDVKYAFCWVINIIFIFYLTGYFSELLPTKPTMFAEGLEYIFVPIINFGYFGILSISRGIYHIINIFKKNLSTRN